MTIDPGRISEAAMLLQAVERSGNAFALTPQACGNLAWLLNHALDMAEAGTLPEDFHEAIPLMVDSILGGEQPTG